MVEEGAPSLRQFDSPDAANEEINADFVLEVTDLPAKRWLRRVELLLGGELHASRLGDRDEIAKVPELHLPLSPSGISINIQSLFHRRHSALVSARVEVVWSNSIARRTRAFPQDARGAKKPSVAAPNRERPD